MYTHFIPIIIIGLVNIIFATCVHCIFTCLHCREDKGKVVKCLCDNAAVVAIVRSGRSKHPLVMHLMRSLSLFTAGYNVGLMAEHLPGRENVAADAPDVIQSIL